MRLKKSSGMDHKLFWDRILRTIENTGLEETVRLLFLHPCVRTSSPFSNGQSIENSIDIKYLLTRNTWAFLNTPPPLLLPKILPTMGIQSARKIASFLRLHVILFCVIAEVGQRWISHRHGRKKENIWEINQSQSHLKVYCIWRHDSGHKGEHLK